MCIEDHWHQTRLYSGQFFTSLEAQFQPYYYEEQDIGIQLIISTQDTNSMLVSAF